MILVRLASHDLQVGISNLVLKSGALFVLKTQVEHSGYTLKGKSL